MISAFYHKMLNFVNKLFGSSSQRIIREYSSTVEKINELEKDISNLSDRELKDKTPYFKNLLSKGKSINQIFKENGEEYFRDIETMILLKLIDKKNVILSLGGGSILNKLVREKLKNNSITVFLNVDLVELERRLKKSTNRPLLKDVDIRVKIKNLDISRRKYYLLSDIIIKNTNTVADTCQNFIKKFTNFNEKSNSHKNK